EAARTSAALRARCGPGDLLRYARADRAARGASGVSGRRSTAAQSEREGGAAVERRRGLAGGRGGESVGLFQGDGAVAYRQCTHQASPLYGTEKTVMRHPVETDLALFAGRDLGFISEWQIRRHVSLCDECRATVDAFESLQSETAGLGDLPAEIAWNRMALEMKANIRLG